MTLRGWICAIINATLFFVTGLFSVAGLQTLTAIFMLITFIYTFAFGTFVGFNAYKFYPTKKAEDLINALLELDKMSN